MKLKFPKINPKNGLKTLKTFTTNNAAELCAGGALLCTGVAIFFAIKGTKKCIDELDRAKILKNSEFYNQVDKAMGNDNEEDAYEDVYESDDEVAEKCEDVTAEYNDLTKKEKVVIYAKCYWPVALFAILSGAGVIASVKLKNKQIKAAMIAASMAETALASKTGTLESILSAKQAKEAVMQENEKELDSNKAPSDDSLIERSTILGNTLFYDPLYKRYFYSDIEGIRSAINDAREYFNEGECLTLNDFYINLGIATVECGDMIGWDFDRTGPLRCTLEYDAKVNGRPTVVLKHANVPQAVLGGGYHWSK